MIEGKSRIRNMRLETGEPMYIELLQDFRFSRERDEDTGRILLDLFI